MGNQLSALLNTCLENGVYPKAWKSDKMVILRKGEVTDPKSFRPIMLLPALEKVYEKLLNNQLMSTTKSTGKYSSEKY